MERYINLKLSKKGKAYKHVLRVSNQTAIARRSQDEGTFTQLSVQIGSTTLEMTAVCFREDCPDTDSLSSEVEESDSGAAVEIQNEQKAQDPELFVTLATLSLMKSPTKMPTPAPTSAPTKSPTSFPTADPTMSPSLSPTLQSSKFPSQVPSRIPSSEPSESPTKFPTSFPSPSPASSPVRKPTHAP